MCRMPESDLKASSCCLPLIPLFPKRDDKIESTILSAIIVGKLDRLLVLEHRFCWEKDSHLSFDSWVRFLHQFHLSSTSVV